MVWDPDRFQHGVYLKVAGIKLVYAGSAINLGKRPNGSYGMQVRRAEHEATFADLSAKKVVAFDSTARKLGLADLSFGTLFTYNVTDMKDTKQLEDMRVTRKLAEAILTEWCKAGDWHKGMDWIGACSHCCLIACLSSDQMNHN